MSESGQSDGVVCYAGVDWWYHNRGHSESQIMRRLASRAPVLWVNSIAMRAPAFGKTDLVFRRYARKLRSTLMGLRRDRSGMWIYSPVFLPVYRPDVVALNGRLIAAQVRLILRSLRVRRPSAFVTVPTAGPAVARGAWQRVVFNRSDRFSQFPETDAALIEPLEEALLERADDVVYVNRLLYREERDRVRCAHYLGHGVDFEHFAAARGAAGNGAVPAAVRALPRPIVGYYGTLDSYTIDTELLIKLARRIRPGTLLLIGPLAMKLDRVLAEGNVCYVGPVPYAAVPHYAAVFDVGIMPWLRNAWIEACNPIKLKEYLAVGFPIVSVRFPELAPFASLVYAADTHDEFLAMVDQALQETDTALSEQRRCAASRDTWESIADRVASMLGLANHRREPCSETTTKPGWRS